LRRQERSGGALHIAEDNQQIFASRYKLYLPTESELAAELQRERQTSKWKGVCGKRRAREGPMPAMPATCETRVSIRKLKEVHTATHPARLKRSP